MIGEHISCLWWWLRMHTTHLLHFQKYFPLDVHVNWNNDWPSYLLSVLWSKWYLGRDTLSITRSKTNVAPQKISVILILGNSDNVRITIQVSIICLPIFRFKRLYYLSLTCNSNSFMVWSRIRKAQHSSCRPILPKGENRKAFTEPRGSKIH